MDVKPMREKQMQAKHLAREWVLLVHLIGIPIVGALAWRIVHGAGWIGTSPPWPGIMIRARERTSRRAAVVAGAIVWLTIAGCAGPATTRSQPAPAAVESPNLFRAAVAYFDERTVLPIRVDPRPLRPEARLSTVQENDLIEPAEEVVRMRMSVMESRRWGRTDAAEDWKCVFSEGIPPARDHPVPDSVRAQREACRQRGRYESLVLGLPQHGTDPVHPGRWRIRTMRILPYGFEVVDLFLEDDGGVWHAVDANVRSGVFS
jgi:hypothetical protein